MVKILITTEMRTGSRWIHYLLSELCSVRTSRELDVKDLETHTDIMKLQWKKGTTVKLHHAPPDKILEKIKPHDYKILSIVRNPRDRMVSHAFHQGYKPPGFGLKEIKEAKDDKEAVKVAFFSTNFRKQNEDQFDLMIPTLSTRWKGKRTHAYKDKYLWTSYRWLKENILQEIKTILDFLGVLRTDKFIRRTIIKHSFKRKSGREEGEENRQNEWRRKGIEGDWKNWYTKRMIEKSNKVWNRYWKILEDEENG